MVADRWAGRDGHWDRISVLFETVLSLPLDARATFIEESCGSDGTLRTELESLVAAHDGAPAFLNELYSDVVQPALSQFDTDAPREDLPSAPQMGPGTQIRHFTVHERLGSGGAGVVFRGRDTLLERDVAIKFLAPGVSRDPAARARLIREAQSASRLDDPHVCAIHAIEATVDGGLCIVMAYCAGGTLRDRLRRGPIATAELSVIALHLARGLACAHQAGVVHGDIKPANVGFGDGDVARLLDFGVAVHAHDAESGGHGLSGTLPYLAPELWRGAPRGKSTDVWALGVTYFEMVTGRRPFAGTDPGTLADAILSDPLPSLAREDGSAVAPYFENLIRRMLSTSPGQRPRDGGAVLAAIMAQMRTATDGPATTGPTVEREGHAAQPPSAPRLRRWLGLSVAAGGAALAVGWFASSVPAKVSAPVAVEVARTNAPLSTIAILPFTTRGRRDIEYLANGMVDLLTPAFDATGLVRGVDPNTVIGAAGLRRQAVLDSAAARAVASAVRADRYVVGSVIGDGSTLTFRATLRRLDGREVGRAQATVSDSAGLASGVDALVRQLIATELLAPGDTIAGIAAATTTSSVALRAYLDGERELRDARPAAAVASYQRAVATDSMFALAWYRLARAARWNDVDSLSAAAARRASLLATSLPARQQSLVRAYYTLRFGSPVQAERQLAQIVADYPTDVEAWMLLGEVRFGSNPYYGRPIADAGAAFARVMALDPHNREVTVYLMDLASHADRTGQLDTLFSMYFSPNSAGEQPGIRATYIDLHRRRIHRAVPVSTEPDAMSDPALARVALHRITSDVRDRAAARAYAVLVSTAPASRVDGLLSLATLDVAAGVWNTASARISEAEASDPYAAAEQRALLALAPSVQVSDDSLRAFRRVLALHRSQRTADEHGLSGLERDDLRQYLVALLSVRIGDTSAVMAARNALAKRRPADSRVAAAFSSAIAGHWQLRIGNTRAALLAFEECTPDLPARVRAQHPALEQQLDRLARAVALQQVDRREEATRWYASLLEGAGVTGIPFATAAKSGLRDIAKGLSPP